MRLDGTLSDRLDVRKPVEMTLVQDNTGRNGMLAVSVPVEMTRLKDFWMQFT